MGQPGLDGRHRRHVSLPGLDGRRGRLRARPRRGYGRRALCRPHCLRPHDEGCPALRTHACLLHIRPHNRTADQHHRRERRHLAGLRRGLQQRLRVLRRRRAVFRPGRLLAARRTQRRRRTQPDRRRHRRLLPGWRRPRLPGAFADGDDTSVGFGEGTYAEIPHEVLHQSTNLAVELWFRTSRPVVLVGDQANELDGATTPAGGWTPVLYVGSDSKLHGKFYATPSVTTTPRASATTVTDNVWHHAVVSASGSTQTLYLDGVRQGTFTGAVNHQSNKYTYIGAGFAAGSWPASPGDISYFPGQIDEVAIYAKPLDEASVTRHYQARAGMVSGDGMQYRGAVTGDSPSAYWRFDEPAGTSTAKSAIIGGAANGVCANVALGQTGVFGTGDNTAARFAGSASVRIPYASIEGDSSLAAELWFRTTKTGGVLATLQDAEIGQRPSKFSPYLSIDGAGRLRGQFYTTEYAGTKPIVSPQTVNDNTWHHAELTSDGTTQTLYLDGVAVGSLKGTVETRPGQHAYLGAGWGNEGWMGVTGSHAYFQGDLDEAALYDHPLTADQVAAHFNSREYSNISALASTVTVTDPAGRTTSSTYDALRGKRLLATTDQDGGTTTFTYDTGGFPHTVTDPNGHSVISGHDASGNPVSRTTCRDADSCWTSFATYHV
ncbi:LamG domain-containing protein [Streptomyces sp. NPDC087437]|uniref:LamG domain-containing protein n=1 Tax=Streptomyces sp. NPDC087437 TaxID=3365789 RepID=UPI00382B9B72